MTKYVRTTLALAALIAAGHDVADLSYAILTYDDGTILEMTVWRLPAPTTERPHGLKYSLFFGRAARELADQAPRDTGNLPPAAAGRGPCLTARGLRFAQRAGCGGSGRSSSRSWHRDWRRGEEECAGSGRGVRRAGVSEDAGETGGGQGIETATRSGPLSRRSRP